MMMMMMAKHKVNEPLTTEKENPLNTPVIHSVTAVKTQPSRA